MLTNIVAKVQEAPKTVVVTREQAKKPMRIDPKEQRITSLIAAGCTNRGNMSLQNGIKIDGRHIGDIEFGTEDGMLIINKEAEVEGAVMGPRAIILGTVRGSLFISGSLVLMPSAKIYGDLVYGSLLVHDGALIDGQIKPASEMPAHGVRPPLEVVPAQSKSATG